ncbi:MAG TPA: DNA polymerase/3'-5' exonuclease PolX, partial [Candidatus Limnocylindria bacterium]|nr:DNA polymerase/3'-5' exonuclease PolX [Candidatus Limnocylindria bacterium]
RLDLPDVWVRKALDKGVTLVANSDAHSTEELDWMEFAVSTARRGWASRAALANTAGLDEVLARRKRRG